MSSVLDSLHEYERIVLPLLLESTDISQTKKKSELSEIKFSRALQWLSNKGLIELSYKKEEFIELDKNGKIYQKEGLPEKRFLKAVKNGKSVKVSDIPLTQQEIGVCLGLLKSKQAIQVTKKKELEVTITDAGKRLLEKTMPEETFLQKTFPLLATDLEDIEKHVVDQLSKRREIIKREVKQHPVITLTSVAKKINPKDILSEKTTGQLTAAMLKNDSYKKKKFRPFDVKSRVPAIAGGRIHPMTAVIRIVREIFIEMGFQEMKGPWVETAFWCMDSMWIPQDHPARDEQDTFYLNKKGALPDKKLVQKVKQVHETGGKTGSTGYGYKWDPELAKELILRTHTTATTYRTLHKGIKVPCKYFYIGKVFRNEAIDATHLPEFYQVEGFVVAPGLTLQHLLGFIKEFYAKLGYHKIKFKPVYNPYTEPSVEALYYDEKRKKWMELINSGIFRPESLAPYGIKDPVIAWGLGLERLAMIMLEQNKLKDIIGPHSDLRWLRSYKEPKRW